MAVLWIVIGVVVLLFGMLTLRTSDVAFEKLIEEMENRKH